MRRKKLKSILAVAASFVLTLACLTGCGQSNEQASGSTLGEGGILYLSVNPSIAVTYDNDGIVTKVEARNDDGSIILESFSDYKGKECREVVTELVTAIGEAGYFVEEVEGETRQITIEIESGSMLPSDTFLDDIVSDVRTCVNSNDWQSPVDVEGESHYGITDYVDTDYGPENDGATDYDDTDYGPDNDGVTDYNVPATEPASTPVPDDGATDYDDTDYGPDNDGVTDYNDTTDDGTTNYDDTDYGPENDGATDYSVPAPEPAPAPVPDDGATDYDDTDYGPDNDGVTDYDDNTDDGATDYDDTDYGPNNDGVTDYSEPAPEPTPEPEPAPATVPDDGATDYDDTDYGPDNDGVTDYDDNTDDGASDYDDGTSDYDDDASNYDDGTSDYDDGGSDYDD